MTNFPDHTLFPPTICPLILPSNFHSTKAGNPKPAISFALERPLDIPFCRQPSGHSPRPIDCPFFTGPSQVVGGVTQTEIDSWSDSIILVLNLARYMSKYLLGVAQAYSLGPLGPSRRSLRQPVARRLSAGTPTNHVTNWGCEGTN